MRVVSGKSITIHVLIKYTMPSNRVTDSSMAHAVDIRCLLKQWTPRSTDSQTDYGNEQESGEGVARAIKEGIVKREDLFLVSKLWNSFHDGDKVEPICKKQLTDWGIDYFDLYIMHFPISLKYVDPKDRYPPGFTYDGKNVVPGKASIQETWTAMESLVDKGLAKSIGISNFNGQLIMDLLRYAKIPPATLQVEHHPYLTQEGLVKLAKDNDIAVTAYSSFGPQSFLELDMQQAKDTPLLFDNPTVKSIADKHDKTPAQVLLRWATQRDVAVIPKSNNQNRLAQNLDVTSFDLGKDELDNISGLNKNLRFNDPVNVSTDVQCPNIPIELLADIKLKSMASSSQYTYRRTIEVEYCILTEGRGISEITKSMSSMGTFVNGRGIVIGCLSCYANTTLHLECSCPQP